MSAYVRTFLRNYRLTWQAAPFATFGSTVLELLAAIRPTAFTVVSGLVVGSIPAAVAHGLGSPDGRHLLVLLAAATAIETLNNLIGPALQLLMMGMDTGVAEMTRRHVIQTGLEPGGLAHLEDPAFGDQVALARGEGTVNPRSTPAMMKDVVHAWLVPIGAALILFRYVWWAPLVLGAAALCLRRWQGEQVELQYEAARGGIQDFRRAGYYRDLVLDGSAAKELRVFGLGTFVLDRLVGHSLRALGEIWRRRARFTWLMAATIGTVVVSQAAVYGALGWSAVHHTLGLAGLAMCVQAAQNVVGMGSMWAEMRYRLASKAMQAATTLPAAVTPLARVAGSAPADGLPAREIRFERVRFRYPGGERDVFASLDLTVRAGASTAIVGRNGAGKTTLTKLLARLYEPLDGRVTVDGTDLRELSPTAWRVRLAVVFQDFVHYEMPATDNVGFGALELAGDRGALEEAAARAGALDLVEGLPSGWDTILSRAYTGGSDLSGGQWQRIALARALLAARRGSVLVLDEPTASLDVRAEAEIFDRFLELTRGLTTILISHRFSTVRHADRILVLEEGRVVEEGSHDELLAARGRYAEMFLMQANRFR